MTYVFLKLTDCEVSQCQTYKIDVISIHLIIFNYLPSILKESYNGVKLHNKYSALKDENVHFDED